jgi:hypothetical protein
MVDINLHKTAEKELRIKKNKSFFKSGSFIAFSLLVFTLIVFGGTLLYQERLKVKKVSLAQEKKNQIESIDKEKINELVDFQERVDAAFSNLENRGDPRNRLDTIESLVVKDVVLNELSVDEEGLLEMEATTVSFKNAASQMLSFKKNEMFTDVRIASSGRDDGGNVLFVLEADIKK